jgi:spermidine synthase
VSSRASAGILLVAGISGTCSMILELAAVRLVAPWYGTSTTVWTNVIGVVLLALAGGYLFGARLSRGALPARSLGFCLVGAAILTGGLPGLAGTVVRWFRPGELALDEAFQLLRWGSLATALLLFVPPTLLLGCVPPLASEILERRGERTAGDAGGRVLAASTAGSLLGTFATTYWVLPGLGISRTFAAAGLALALLGAIVLAGAWRPAGSVAALVVAAAWTALFGRSSAGPETSPGWKVVDAAESPYQSLRVVEGEDGGRKMRRLQVNEGLDSFQSVWQEREGWLPEGYYYNLFALPPWWSARSTRPPRDGRWRTCVLGLGAGTAWRVLSGALPPGVRLEAVGAEIDPGVVAMGEAWFDLPRADPSRRVLAGFDARVALAALPAGFDEIVLDAYANQMEIPEHLCSREFFAEARAKLAPGGWLCVNVGGFGLDDPVVQAVARTAASAFGERLLALRVPFSRNCVLFVRAGAEPPEPGGAGWTLGEAELEARIARLALPGVSRWFAPEPSAPLADDRNPIAALQRESVEHGKERWLRSR